MKKIIVLALLLLIITSGVFAIDKAIGFGGMYNHSFTMGYWEDRSYYNSYGNLVYYDTDWTLTRNGFGGFIFFGISQYIELNVGFLYKNPIFLIEKDSDGDTRESELDWEPVFALQGGIYLKKPFNIFDTFVFFPTVGADFEYTIDAEEVG